MAEGEVLEIIKEETMLGKRKFKASEKDPRIKVKSSTSGKEVGFQRTDMHLCLNRYAGYTQTRSLLLEVKEQIV